MKLENQVAIVTGAGRNIGEAVGHSFVEEGAKVALVDVRLEAAQAVADAINAEHPGCAIAVQADVSSSEDVQHIVTATVEAFGGVDILVNNAAITDHTPALDLPEDEWDRIIDVTLKSVFLTAKYVGRQMRDQGRGGKIINVASTSGHRGPRRRDSVLGGEGRRVEPHALACHPVRPVRCAGELADAQPHRLAGWTGGAAVGGPRRVEPRGSAGDAAGHRQGDGLPRVGRRRLHRGGRPAGGRRLARGRAPHAAADPEPVGPPHPPPPARWSAPSPVIPAEAGIQRGHQATGVAQ